MVEMDSENGIWKNLICSTDHAFQHSAVRVGASAFANLDDERCLAVKITAEQPHRLFHVVDVISAKGIFSISRFK